MGINLWILYYDLADWGIKRHNPGEILEFPLEHFRFYEPDTEMAAKFLYIVDPHTLADAFSHYPDASFLCIGKPDNMHLFCGLRMLWLPEDTNLQKLASFLAELFYTYQKWLYELDIITLKGSPLEQFGTVSLPLFRKPLSLFYHNFLTLFYTYDEIYGKLPENYSVYQENTYITEEVMLSIEIDDALGKAMKETLPYIFSGTDGIKNLCHNIWVGQKHIATLQIDAVNHPVNERDTALVYLLGEAVRASMMKNNLVNLSLSTGFQEIIRDMLERKNINMYTLEESLKKKSWHLTDTYACIVCRPINKSIPENALFVNGESFVQLIPHSIYILFQNEILLFWNRSHVDASQYWASLKKLRHKLINFNFIAGISNDFQGFDKIVYFYKAASEALTYGSSLYPGQYLYYYEAYMLRLFYDKCLADTIADTLIPSELLELILYDRKKQGDCCKVLECLLKNNMNTTETANELFMHRNTVIKRTTQFKERFRMNLNNHEYRMKLMIAFEVLKGQADGLP